MQNFQSQTVQSRYDKGMLSKNTKTIDTAMKSTDNNDDEAQMLAGLMLRVANHRDKAAFAKLFAHFSPKIRSFGIQRLSQQGLAMDLVQETMTRVWTKAHLYNVDKAAVSTWVFTVMRNQCFDMLRKVQHNREDAFGDDIWSLFDSDGSDETENDFKLSATLLKHVESLPPLQKQVVQGIYMQELTQQELADKLKVPIGTVKSRLRLGLEKLKGFMEKHYD
ncbi:sigma-70 family RNA polymerase sigma factor [Shewanella sp. 3_MG-2023]|uniref:sigma-70 family RNA polymerase sigma factor n=1 Tax=Shewanella sp. 3_MG-2023 TaxID=3062635 RepID=UPI0026E22A23|nr:sigma-70 family RNA polymerase sigma factor [Shewanella sp. 3_MG-2023]MDO6775240.1 sigma-70 family RNA polymerase sigma factor [Shewanella sp. 3_MG-2023]